MSRRHTEETKRKISKALKGRHVPHEIRKKISKTMMGRKKGPMAEETKRKISETMKGRKRKPHSEETKRKISEALKGQPKSAETRKKLSEALKGQTIPLEVRRKISETLKITCKDPERKRNTAIALHAPNGTTLEQEFDSFLQRITPIFTYGGNAYICRVGTGHTGKWPDWFNERRKLAIDLFSERWHSEEFTGMSRREHEQERINYFRQYNWNLLIIWENDFRNNPNEVRERILGFVN